MLDGRGRVRCAVCADGRFSNKNIVGAALEADVISTFVLCHSGWNQSVSVEVMLD